MSPDLRIVVTGLIAQHPLLGGVTWDYLQYPLGLRQLGHDVYYIEDSGEWPYKTDGGPTGTDWEARDCSVNLKHLSNLFDRFGLANRWAYRFPRTGEWFGLPDTKRREVLESSDLLLNVSGTLEWPENYRKVKRLAYIDSDPVFTQAKLLIGQTRGASRKMSLFSDRIPWHDIYFSFGEDFPADAPATGYKWIPTRQPISLAEWRPLAARRGRFTTIMSWTSYEPLRHAGHTYGQKDVELRRFLDLPREVPGTEFEIAMNKTQHANWEAGGEGGELSPADRLTGAGWSIVDPDLVCADLDGYRTYIESSSAEWSVAKNGYVQGNAAWFSCRSACYLAAGRPVVVQDTGFSRVLPVGRGILAFHTLEEAAAGVREVEANYETHSSAALDIAREYFDSDKVLTRLIEQAMSVSLEKTRALNQVF